MSWIPGISAISNWLTPESKNVSTPPGSHTTAPINDIPSQISSSSNNSLASIDPTGFERAAIAIKEINKSPHASKILEISSEQEKTKRRELELHQEQIRLSIVREKSELFKRDQDAKKESQVQEAERQQRLAQYKDQLERQRYSDQVKQQKQLQSEKLRAQEESILKQEALRKSTLDYENNLKLEADLNKIKAKTYAKGDVERQNKDLTLDQIKLRELERRKTIIESIGEVSYCH